MSHASRRASTLNPATVSAPIDAVQACEDAVRTPGQTRHTYRPDVDGLRAVAVGTVVVCHYFPARLPGGFVGVDIFFVISGYLISGILSRGVEAGTFSYASFYSKRARRIFPAMLVVFSTTLLMGAALVRPRLAFAVCMLSGYHVAPPLLAMLIDD